MAVPYAKCSSLCRHLFHFWERKSEDSWACKVRLKESRLVGSKETSPAVRPQDAIWCGIRKESGIICQAQPPGIWVLIDASGRSSYQEAPCCPGIWKIMLRFAFLFSFSFTILQQQMLLSPIHTTPFIFVWFLSEQNTLKSLYNMVWKRKSPRLLLGQITSLSVNRSVRSRADKSF